MDKLDSEIIKWVQVAKGDVVGHPFHGNQYILTASEIVANKARELEGVVSAQGDDINRSAEHDEMKKTHLALSNDLARKADEASSPEEKKALLEASQAHRDAYIEHLGASDAHKDVAGFVQTYSNDAPDFENPEEHIEGTSYAADASQKANELTQRALVA
jgi:hypothetical protein